MVFRVFALKAHPFLFYPILVALLFIVFLGSLFMGGVSVPFGFTWGILLEKIHVISADIDIPQGFKSIIWDLRLPRAILALIVGAGLSIVGVSLQALTRNPLADPHLLGISSGSAFGAILAIMHVGMILGPLTIPIFAFLGSLIVTILVILLSSYTQSYSSTKLVLLGVAISFVVMAAANFLIIFGNPKATHIVVYWMLGGLGTAEWRILPICILVLIIAFLYFWMNSSKLNAITLGDETATTLGIDTSMFRLFAFGVGALLTGVLVAYSGIIGFVGLMVPHIARLFVGGNNAQLLPASMILGALFLLSSDLLSRTLLAPQVIPIGVITGLIGGGFFLWLLAKR